MSVSERASELDSVIAHNYVIEDLIAHQKRALQSRLVSASYTMSLASIIFMVHFLISPSINFCRECRGEFSL